MIKTSHATGNKVQERVFTIKGSQYNFKVTARRMRYQTFKGLQWGVITYSAVLDHNNEGITSASMGRKGLLSQLNIIDNSPKGMFK